jgi:uncharacterized protein (DUF2141 family)
VGRGISRIVHFGAVVLLGGGVGGSGAAGVGGGGENAAAPAAAPVAVAAPAAVAAPVPVGRVVVEVRGLRSRAGSLRARLVASAEGFPGSDAHVVAKRRLPIGGARVRFVFEGVPLGAYALVCLHDEDDDAALARTALGLPAEGLGFSSGARVRFGPPGFEEARFELAGPEAVLVVEMRYGI